MIVLKGHLSTFGLLVTSHHCIVSFIVWYLLHVSVLVEWCPFLEVSTTLYVTFSSEGVWFNNIIYLFVC